MKPHTIIFVFAMLEAKIRETPFFKVQSGKITVLFVTMKVQDEEKVSVK